MTLKELRESRKWTQAELANRAYEASQISISSSSISGLETGRYWITAEQAIALGAAYRLTPGEICQYAIESRKEADAVAS